MSAGDRPPNVSTRSGTHVTPAARRARVIAVAYMTGACAPVEPPICRHAAPPPPHHRVGRRLRRVAEAHVRAAQARLPGHRADRVEHLQVEDLERALDEQREVGPVVGVAVVVVGLTPQLAAVHAAQRVVDGRVDEEVPRRVARLPI